MSEIASFDIFASWCDFLALAVKNVNEYLSK